MFANGSGKKVVAGRKNYLDNRSHIGWKHGTDVDGNSKKVKCNYCSKNFCGGIFRFKHHLAGTRENVEACLNVSDEVRAKILEIIINAKENAEKKRLRIDVGDDEANIGNAVINVFNKPKGSGAGSRIGSTLTQSTINHMFEKDLREETCKQIARFFYTSAVPFNCIKNPEFTKLLELVGKFGQGLKPPSYHEIREKYLNMEVNEIEEMLKEYKEEWKRVGCSIMSDGWTDRKRRSIYGLFKCLDRFILDEDTRSMIDRQMVDFSEARCMFGLNSAKANREKMSPVDWWLAYGDGCPELQKFAIRILSLTCSSSGCERNWSAFEMVHTKRRNRLHQKKMNALVYVMSNLKLRNKEKRSHVSSFDDMHSDDEWITEGIDVEDEEDEVEQPLYVNDFGGYVCHSN
ncbi:uncharacterized protein G2W53_010660 [Senna tora]|uniref:BED-type domain-containing protein n=1 Tax=Senna tora TaxID=362788 RepID=A0A835CBN4_9FABA|nr:uncharacterized protein G2W53_010660 [Senna tora]